MTFREFMSENGYTVQTTFWEDFTIVSDRIGIGSQSQDLAASQEPS